MEIKMRKPSYSEVYMYKNLFWLAIGVFAFVPFFNSFILQVVQLYVEGDIVYGGLSDGILMAREWLSTLASHIGLGTVAVSVIYFGSNARGIIGLMFASQGVGLISSLFAYIVCGGEDIISAIFILFSDVIATEAVYGLILFLLLRFVKKNGTVLNIAPYKVRFLDFSHPVTKGVLIAVSVFGAASLIALIYRMVGDFIDPSLGMPINIYEWLYWVLEYLNVFIRYIVGYIAAMAVTVLASFYVRKVKRA